MSPIETRLARAGRVLAVAQTARALLMALAVGAAMLALGLLIDAAMGLPLGVRRAVLPFAAVASALVLTWRVARDVLAALRATRESLALWFEARLPELRYALVTSVDPAADGDVRARLERVAAAAPLEREVKQATRHALLRPAVAALVMVFALILAPSGAVGRVAAPAPGDALARPGAAARAVADPLASIVVRVTPPAYTGLGASAYDDPSTVSALVGGRVRIEGLGQGVRADVDGTVTASRGTDGWSIDLPVPTQATAVRLIGSVRERMLVVDPVTDSVPTVRLDQPTRDSVLRVAEGRVFLLADVRDDFGVADAAFEFIASSGAGETFTFRSGRVAARTFGAGTRTARIEGTLSLDTLKLGPGDLIHLRAVARDRNDVTGPGLGASETRTLRIARADEYDSVSVDPMPPTEPEKNALSQRMVLMLTQELVQRLPRISEAERTRESRKIALEQTRIRKRVGEVVFLRLGEDGGEHAHFAGDGHNHGKEGVLNPDDILAAAERAANADPTKQLEGHGDETPIVAINRPLLEAYNHMWRAATELETSSPRTAIPWMERAIEALQRARAAERIYLRGRPPRVVVDLAKVRGVGKEKHAPGDRSARAPLDAARQARLDRFDAALELLATDANAAADSLLLVRLAVPVDERSTARVLDAAADAVRKGGDVTAALQAARRALAGAPRREGALTGWGR
ncbi:MAG: hypothetical protein ACKVS7_02800 [Gemmatimonadaceae bacterium]